MKAPPLRETDVHLQVAAFLPVGLGGNALGFHIPNESSVVADRIRAAEMGALFGITDFEFLSGSRAIFIEIKPVGWRERKLRNRRFTIHERRQLEVHRLLRRAGCPVEICESYDEVVGALRWHGVPLTVRDVGILPPREAAAALAARAVVG